MVAYELSYTLFNGNQFPQVIFRAHSFVAYAYSCRISSLEFFNHFRPKRQQNIPAGKFECYTRMLQMNAPLNKRQPSNKRQYYDGECLSTIRPCGLGVPPFELNEYSNPGV